MLAAGLASAAGSSKPSFGDDSDSDSVSAEQLYAEALEAGPREATWIDPLRRAELLLLQRESAHGRVLPETGPS